MEIEQIPVVRSSAQTADGETGAVGIGNKVVFCSIVPDAGAPRNYSAGSAPPTFSTI